MARLRSAHYEDNQLAILEKAAELFGRKGYERSSISDLTDACQLSRGALYHYFDSKEAILFAMLDAHVRGFLETLEDAVAEAGSPTEKLYRAVERMIVFNAASPHVQVILLNDLASLSQRQQQQIIAIQHQIVDMVGDIIGTLDSGGRISKGSRKVYTMMLFGILNYTYTWYDPSGPIKPRHYARMTTDLFLHGVLQHQNAGAMRSATGVPAARQRSGSR